MSGLTFNATDHSYHYDGMWVPSCTRILKAYNRTLQWIDDDVLDRASKFGQAVHKGCELLAQGKLEWDSVHPALVPYIRQFERFLADTGFSLMAAEEPVFNPTHRYAGTLDLRGRMSGELALIDVKSGAPQVWHELQTAGYEGCLAARHERFCLYLNGGSDNRYRLVPNRGATDRAVFYNAAALYHWMRSKSLV